VINHTEQARNFAPEFILITDTRQRVADAVLPNAVEAIKAKEDPTIPLLGAVDIVGTIPPSNKQGVDDAVYGVAVWDNVDTKADAFQVFVRGLSNAYHEAKLPDGKPYTRYKAVRVDFIRFGDERDINSKEIRLGDPPYEWVYYP
jgi:hypothetical protein